MHKIDGVPFECTMCGDCCRWEGEVNLLESDLKRLSDFHGISISSYLEKYTKMKNGLIVLINKDDGRSCIYLNDNNKCSLHNIKPKQCVDYPRRYDARCPGFKREEKAMSRYVEKVAEMNKRFSNLKDYEKTVSDNLYKDLKKSAKAYKVASTVLEESIDYCLCPEKLKVASLSDLFGFERLDKEHLVHKSTKDLWSIESNETGEIFISRLFNNSGEPIKG